MPDPEFPGTPPRQVVLHSGAGRGQYLRVGWELLCPGGYREAGLGRQRRHAARGSGALQHSGGDQALWRSIGEDSISCFISQIIVD